MSTTYWVCSAACVVVSIQSFWYLEAELKKCAKFWFLEVRKGCVLFLAWSIAVSGCLKLCRVQFNIRHIGTFLKLLNDAFVMCCLFLVDYVSYYSEESSNDWDLFFKVSNLFLKLKDLWISIYCFLSIKRGTWHAQNRKCGEGCVSLQAGCRYTVCKK